MYVEVTNNFKGNTEIVLQDTRLGVHGITDPSVLLFA